MESREIKLYSITPLNDKESLITTYRFIDGKRKYEEFEKDVRFKVHKNKASLKTHEMFLKMNNYKYASCEKYFTESDVTDPDEDRASYFMGYDVLNSENKNYVLYFGEYCFREHVIKEYQKNLENYNYKRCIHYITYITNYDDLTIGYVDIFIIGDDIKLFYDDVRYCSSLSELISEEKYLAEKGHVDFRTTSYYNEEIIKTRKKM